MTGKRILIGIAGIVCTFCVLFVYAGCDNLYANRVLVPKVKPSSDIAVAFNDLTANGSPTATTTRLTLTFDNDIDGLAADDITITEKSSGASKGMLTKIATGVYELEVGGITAGGQITVSVEKAGYAIATASRQVMIYQYTAPGDTSAAFNGLFADGSTTATTTKLTLIFNQDITGLAAENITLSTNGTGASKGTLTKTTGTGVYELTVGGITLGGEITISVARAGYAITPASKPVTIYQYTAVGDTPAAFKDLTADGSSTETTTKLTLTFDKNITGLIADDITLTANSTGAIRGTLTKTTGTGVYELTVGGITSGGEITISVAKTGYAITPASKQVTIYQYTASGDISVAFSGLAQDGSFTATTTKLTLTFSRDITDLAAEDIFITVGSTGIIKNGLVKGTGTGVYELNVRNVSADGDISVSVTKAGWTITANQKQVTVFYAAPVTFNSLTADGSSTATTTKLTLTFDKDITGLTANDIEFTANETGATKGTLTKTDTGVYDLTVSGITAGGQVTVGAAKAGYEIIPAAKDAAIFCVGSNGITVAFSGLPQDETIELEAAQILLWDANTPLVISPLSGYDSYQWYLDGNLLSGKTGNAITLYSGDYRLGKHRLTVEVGKDGAFYSKTVNFAVTDSTILSGTVGIALPSGARMYAYSDPTCSVMIGNAVINSDNTWSISIPKFNGNMAAYFSAVFTQPGYNQIDYTYYSEVTGPVNIAGTGASGIAVNIASFEISGAPVEKTINVPYTGYWFRLIPDYDGVIILDAETVSLGDVYMHLYDGQTWQQLTSDDNGGEGNNSRITYQVTAGHSYIVLVRAYSTGTGVVRFKANVGVAAALSNLAVDGSPAATTTQLTLTFDKTITGLTADDLSLNGNGTGAVKGVLTDRGSGVYELAVGGITAGGTVTVGVTKYGYLFSPASQSVTVYAAESGYVFTTSGEYRQTISVAGSSVTIEGSDTGFSDKGVFVAGRTVTLSPYSMAKYQTTWELWNEVRTWAQSHGYSIENEGYQGHDSVSSSGYGSGTSSSSWTLEQRQRRPVTMISWYDAIVWCNAYSEMSGLEPVYYYNEVILERSADAHNAVMDRSKNGYRLPTEAEWEFAARGGDPTAADWAYEYAGSNTAGEVGWYYDNATSGTDYGAHTVGTKAANRLGIYDLSGNVYEWCWDWYEGIYSGSVTDPSGASSGSLRVLRGGSWGDDARFVRSSYRSSYDPDGRYDSLGFRIVRF